VLSYTILLAVKVITHCTTSSVSCCPLFGRLVMEGREDGGGRMEYEMEESILRLSLRQSLLF
jgi:hypothetical protein